MSSKRSLLGATAATALMLALAGCGGGGGSAGGSVSTNVGKVEASSSATGSSAFVNEVLKIIATGAEHDEPVSVDSLTVTSPDVGEPQPIS